MRKKSHNKTAVRFLHHSQIEWVILIVLQFSELKLTNQKNIGSSGLTA